jgi:S1-C subfamily serine protease
MMVDLQKLHEDVLYTQVRVHTGKAGGSGTVVYSGKGKKKDTTIVLTCHHVIEGALSVKKEYDPRIGMDRKKEYRQVVGVEFFDYASVPHGRRPVSNSVDADVIAYDKTHDMALLKLRMETKAPYVAKLLPEDEIESVKVGDKTYAVGCALLHDPILTEGMITHMGDEIDYNDYWMSSAQIIFGNSGGAMFRPDDGSFSFIGVPSRIDVAGWSDPITHLGYFSPINRVYKFIRDEHYEFIVDPDFTEEQCEKLREGVKKKAEGRRFMPVEEEDES